MSPDRVSSYVDHFRSFLKDPNRPFSILARIPVKEGAQAAFEAAFARAITATRREPGVIAYYLNREAESSTRYMVYERWKNLSVFEDHLRTAYITELIQITDESLAGLPEFQVFIPAGE